VANTHWGITGADNLALGKQRCHWWAFWECIRNPSTSQPFSVPVKGDYTARPVPRIILLKIKESETNYFKNRRFNIKNLRGRSLQTAVLILLPTV
jgi:hypothetical protein